MASESYFTREELDCPCCGAYGMDPMFIITLNKVRKAFGRGMIITSGFRCKKYNELIKGAPQSQHMLGKAVDVLVKDKSEQYKLIRWAMTYNLSGIGVGTDFIHLDGRDSAPLIWTYPSAAK